MGRTRGLAFVALLALCLATWLHAQVPEDLDGLPSPAPFDTEEPSPLLVGPIAAPRPALLSDGSVELNYELELRAPLAVVIESLDVVDPLREDAVVATLSGEQLQRRVRLYGQTEPGLALTPGVLGYLRIGLTFARLEDVPRFLDHRFTLIATIKPATEPATLVQRLARCPVDLRRPPVISPPVSGDRWVAGVVGGERDHRRAVMPVNGRWVAPERWAVDWIKLDPSNRLVTGDPTLNTSYPQYGQPLLAVADGRIVKTRDGMPDIPAGEEPPVVILHEAAGNYVVLDIGRGYFATYAHISPGTIPVSEGQWVHRGQVLGLLGNSGNTSGPHLHFQVNDERLPLGSDGVPYVINRFRVQGQVMSADDLESELEHPEIPVTVVPGPNPGHHGREMPANLSLISFPERGGR